MFSSRRFQVALLAVLCTAVGAAAAPGASAAVQRYASPIGAGNECSAAKPCKVDFAINYAPAGAEVILRPGDYAVSYAIKNTAPSVVIHGVAGQARPTLHLNAGSSLQVQDAELAYVEVVQSSAALPALAALRSKLDRLSLRGGPQANCAAAIYNGTMSNSVVVARYASGDAICSPGTGANDSSAYLNVTAIAQGGAAIHAFTADPTATVDVKAVNVIATAGDTGAGFEATNNIGGHATIAVAHSNYRKSSTYGVNATVLSVGGNQAGTPTFVDEATGDYRQKAGSVTIDAGDDDPASGSVDIDGDPRRIGRTDIGADEFVPPPAGGGETPPPLDGGDTGGTAFAGVKLISTALTLKHGFVTLKLDCPAATAGRCTGVTKLSALRKRLGRARFSIAAGGRTKLKLRVSRAGRHLLARRHRLRGGAANSAHDAAGLSRTTRSRVTIRKGTR